MGFACLSMLVHVVLSLPERRVVNRGSPGCERSLMMLKGLVVGSLLSFFLNLQMSVRQDTLNIATVKV